MIIKRFWKIILPLLALMFLLSFLQTLSIAATETAREEPRSREFFWEEAKWGSVFALLTMLGVGALMSPACELACSGIPDPLAQEGCRWNCGWTLGTIGFLAVPLGATVGVAWTAWRHEIHMDLSRLLATYGGSLVSQAFTVFILAYIRWPDFLVTSPIVPGLTFAIVATADGLGATYGFNLWNRTRPSAAKSR